jgi:trans-aconitate 2-methyltransferase
MSDLPASPSSPSAWNPDQYNKFQNERSQPFYDLLAMVQPVPGGLAIDLGCGTGELTRELHRHAQARSTIGLDNSETMLERSKQFAGSGLTFKLGTVLRFAPRTPFDIVFSNAAMQWVPDHEKLFERLAAGLAEGGQLAIQMPSNHDHPSHLIAHEVAREEPFLSELGGYTRYVPVQPVDWYAQKLFDLGLREQSVRMQVYGHVLESREAVIEWVKGTLLTDYEQRLSPEMYAEYLARYRERLLPELSDSKPYLYPFKRILLWARK